MSFINDAIRQIKEYVLNNKLRKKITFIWHGGEPLLWGIENFRKVLEFQEKELSELDYGNSIQTNLSLLTEDYVDLFIKHDVHIGFSIDGFRELNDSQRVFADGKHSIKYDCQFD